MFHGSNHSPWEEIPVFIEKPNRVSILHLRSMYGYKGVCITCILLCIFVMLTGALTHGITDVKHMVYSKNYSSTDLANHIYSDNVYLLDTFLDTYRDQYCTSSVEVALEFGHLTFRGQYRNRHYININTVSISTDAVLISVTETSLHCKDDDSTKDEDIVVRQSNRWTSIHITAYNIGIRKYVTEEWVGVDALCVQLYTDIRDGNWPCDHQTAHLSEEL